jgi:hypothetical protein
LTAGIVALLALAAHMAVPTAREGGSTGQMDAGAKTKKKQTQETENTSSPSEGPWIATRHFFQPYEAAPDISPQIFKNPGDILACSGNSTCLPQLQQYFGLPNTDGVECVLATVPDPFHTRLALFTDNAIAAILRGAAEANWEFAAQWLPWSDTVDPDEGDPAKRAQQRSYIREQEEQPGVLVFRHADQSRGALLFFVVGETPIAGVNPRQFQIARAYMRVLCDPHRNPRQVRIVGPASSGSFDSLARLILQDKVKQPGMTYQIRSGTTQSSGDADAFRGRVGLGPGEFHSATGNLSDQYKHFADVLSGLRIPPEQAALLVEGESAFGTAASGIGKRTPLRVLTYPRDISHLRNVYRQVQQASQPDKSPVPNLDFSLKDPTIGEDSVPTYSQTQTPLSQNGVVNEITRAIRRDDIRIVEVSATNVLDLVFLAGVLRRQCPDTRLLIQSADLLFVLAEQTQPLDGTLFLTSHPLFAESKLWEGRNDIPVFPDTLSEGVFNATVLLLTGDHPRATALTDYAWRSVDYPPDWLLILDRRGLTPVRVWPNDATEGWFQSVPGLTGGLDPTKVPSPRIWNLLLSAFAFFSVAIGIWILRLCGQKDWVVDARFEPPESEGSWRGFYLLLFLLILIGIQIVIRVARPLGTDGQWSIVMLLGCALPVWIAVRHCRPGKERRLATWLAAFAVLAGVTLWGFCCVRAGYQGQLFSFRAAELRFGSSPLWPIVAAATALLLWCSVHVTRFYFACRQQPEVLTHGLDSVLKERLKKSHDHFNESAHSALGLFTAHPRRLLAISLAALAALCYLFHVYAQLASIDGRPYDLLCTTLQILLAGLMLLTCWHVLDLWRSLRDFTTSLDLLPLKHAFVRASPAGGNRPIWVRRLNLQSLDIHINSALVLNDMGLQRKQLAKYGLSKDQLNRWQTPFRYGIGILLADPPLGDRKELADRRRKLSCLNKLVAGRMWSLILRPAWASKPMLGKVTGEPSPKPQEQAPEEQDAIAPIRQRPVSAYSAPRNVMDLAERFVALHYSPFLLYGVRQIQNLLWFSSVGFVLLMFSMNSYSFQAPQAIGRSLLILFAVITWILGKCLIQMERDPVLSRIAGTQPGELNATFYLKLAQYGAVPILGLLASLFPSISNLLFSWFEPALEALK